MIIFAASLILLGVIVLVVMLRHRIDGLLLRVFGDSDPYEPAAAETPDAADEAAEQAVDAFGFQRAKPWTGTEEAVISELDVEQLIGDIAAAVEAYRAGVEIWADAVREMAP